MQTPRVRLLRHESPHMHFELAFAAPDSTLGPYVRDYVGWVEHSTASGRRRELPSGEVPLIVNFGPGVRERKGHSNAWSEHGTFTAGVHEAFTVVESTGPSHGMQVNFTAIGARLFYDRPLVDFANRTVDLADVIGSVADTLVARLYDAGSWEARFVLLDHEIGSRISAARQPNESVIWAWDAFRKSGGRARIQALVREIGWSERHFAAQFRDHIGITPKAFARILRFTRAVRVLTTRHDVTLADVALGCGYYDQAHFTNDFHAFAGTTPSGLLESRLPDGGFRART